MNKIFCSNKNNYINNINSITNKSVNMEKFDIRIKNQKQGDNISSITIFCLGILCIILGDQIGQIIFKPELSDDDTQLPNNNNQIII